MKVKIEFSRMERILIGYIIMLGTPLVWVIVLPLNTLLLSILASLFIEGLGLAIVMQVIINDRIEWEKKNVNK